MKAGSEHERQEYVIWVSQPIISVVKAGMRTVVGTAWFTVTVTSCCGTRFIRDVVQSVVNLTQKAKDALMVG